MLAEMSADEPDIPADFLRASSLAEKLTTLRINAHGANSQINSSPGGVPTSQLQRHERLLAELKMMGRLSSKAQAALDHTMLIRAREGYLFNYTKNQKVVADDSWLSDIWAWVAGKFLVFLSETLNG
jgi:WD repeat-containing protein mio